MLGQQRRSIGQRGEVNRKNSPAQSEKWKSTRPINLRRSDRASWSVEGYLVTLAAATPHKLLLMGSGLIVGHGLLPLLIETTDTRHLSYSQPARQPNSFRISHQIKLHWVRFTELRNQSWIRCKLSIVQLVVQHVLKTNPKQIKVNGAWVVCSLSSTLIFLIFFYNMLYSEYTRRQDVAQLAIRFVDNTSIINPSTHSGVYSCTSMSEPTLARGRFQLLSDVTSFDHSAACGLTRSLSIRWTVTSANRRVDLRGRFQIANRQLNAAV